MAKKVSKAAPKRAAASVKVPEGMERLEVGPGKTIDHEGFSGYVMRRKIGRLEAIRKIDAGQDAIEQNPVKGALKWLEMVGEIFPEIELQYGKHRVQSVEQLFDSVQGAEFINTSLVGHIASGDGVDLSKN